MLVIDASCLFEVLVGSPSALFIGDRLLEDLDHVAPHVIDVEVMGVIRKYHLTGHLDETAATQAVEDLREWPGERYSHRNLLERAWELRSNVRGWDAVYVALAEGLDATLLTMDGRLGNVKGLSCVVEVVRKPGHVT